MKVHVTLDKAVVRDPVARQAALGRVLAAGRMTLGNPRRFERHGIVTGEMDPANLERVRAVAGVLAAELDEQALRNAQAPSVDSGYARLICSASEGVGDTLLPGARRAVVFS
jgi:hypothetical protein